MSAKQPCGVSVMRTWGAIMWAEVLGSCRKGSGLSARLYRMFHVLGQVVDPHWASVSSVAQKGVWISGLQ